MNGNDFIFPESQGPLTTANAGLAVESAAQRTATATVEDREISDP